MRFSCTYAISSSTVYVFVQRVADSLYYRPATTDFEAWIAEAAHRSLLTEDGTFDGLYAVNITANANWVDGTYRALYYVDSISDVNLIGENTFFVRRQQVTDEGEVYDIVKRTVGLGKENEFIDNVVYSGGNMTSCRIRVYATYPFDTSVDTPLATYLTTITYSGTNLTSWKNERQ